MPCAGIARVAFNTTRCDPRVATNGPSYELGKKTLNSCDSDSALSLAKESARRAAASQAIFSAGRRPAGATAGFSIRDMRKPATDWPATDSLAASIDLEGAS